MSAAKGRETIRLAVEHERSMVIDASRGGDAWTYLINRFCVEVTEVADEDLPPGPNGVPWAFAVTPKIVRTLSALTGDFEDVVHRQDVRGNWHPLDASASQRARTVLHIEEIGEVPDARDTEGAIAFLANHALRPRPCGYGWECVTNVFADQYEFGALSVLLRRAGLRPTEVTWTAPSKARAVDRCERLLRDRLIRLPKNETLRRQLSEYSERVTKAGGLTYAGTGRRDDYAQVVTTTCMASVNGLLRGDPFAKDRMRHESPY